MSKKKKLQILEYACENRDEAVKRNLYMSGVGLAVTASGLSVIGMGTPSLAISGLGVVASGMATTGIGTIAVTKACITPNEDSMAEADKANPSVPYGQQRASLYDKNRKVAMQISGRN